MAQAVAERFWCVTVPHHASAAAFARHRMAGELRPLVAPELLADAIAVLAELVGNAIRHAAPLPGGVIRITWHVHGAADRATVEIRVADGGSLLRPQIRVAAPEAVDGRGLAIVATLADRWGVERDDAGRQVVWAALSG